MRRRVDAGEGAGVDLAQSHHRADPVFMLILGGESEAVSADGRTAGAASLRGHRPRQRDPHGFLLCKGDSLAVTKQLR